MLFLRKLLGFFGGGAFFTIFLKEVTWAFTSPELKAQVNYSDRQLSVVRLSVYRLLHFRLLLQNHGANFNQTLYKSSLEEGDFNLFK
jgi:hypothetical protein